MDAAQQHTSVHACTDDERHGVAGRDMRKNKTRITKEGRAR